MSRVPVLKPREVIRALERLGFVEVRQRGRTASSGTPTEEVQQFLSIQAGISRRRS